jgi:hypothetical protein
MSRRTKRASLTLLSIVAATLLSIVAAVFLGRAIKANFFVRDRAVRSRLTLTVE